MCVQPVNNYYSQSTLCVDNQPTLCVYNQSVLHMRPCECDVICRNNYNQSMLAAENKIHGQQRGMCVL